MALPYPEAGLRSSDRPAATSVQLLYLNMFTNSNYLSPSRTFLAVFSSVSYILGGAAAEHLAPLRGRRLDAALYPLIISADHCCFCGFWRTQPPPPPQDTSDHCYGLLKHCFNVLCKINTLTLGLLLRRLSVVYGTSISKDKISISSTNVQIT